MPIRCSRCGRDIVPPEPYVSGPTPFCYHCWMYAPVSELVALERRSEMAIKARVEVAKKELADLVVLFLDETDNMDQLLPMLTEGGEATLACYQLFKDLPEADKLKAGIDIADAIAELFKAKYLKYSDEV